MSLSYRLQVVFICFVPKTDKRAIILGVLIAMHWRQDSTTPDHGILLSIDFSSAEDLELTGEMR